MEVCWISIIENIKIHIFNKEVSVPSVQQVSSESASESSEGGVASLGSRDGMQGLFFDDFPSGVLR